MKRRKNDEGWLFFGILMGPIGVGCLIAGTLLLVLAVMI